MSSTRTTAAHILVIDDEADVCRCLRQALTVAGYEVSAATSREEALRAARQRRPDLVVADLLLNGSTGVEVVDRLRRELGELPAVFITGCGDAAALSEASRRRPVELLNKPVDLARLKQAIWTELHRQDQYQRIARRHARLRELSRRVHRQRRAAYNTLTHTCADLSAACRTLRAQIDRQQTLSEYQTELLRAADEDDVFRRFFRLFVERTGGLFGAAMLCDEDAELQMVGRFGVPTPDGVNFCRTLGASLTNLVLERPEVHSLDAVENLQLFPPELHRMLVGVILLVVPLMACEGQMIGLVVLYRKGEQPFTDDDLAVARLIAPPTAAAVMKM